MADDPVDLGVPASAKTSKARSSGTGDLGVPAAAEVKTEDRSILEPLLGRDYLANKPDDTIVDQALKLTGTALSRVPFMPVGLVGDIRDLGRFGVDWTASKITGTPIEELQRRNAERKAVTGDRWIDRMPTTRELSDEFLRQAGTKPYEPTSTLGKIAMGTIEAGGGGLSSVGQVSARGATKFSPKIAEETILKTAPLAGVAGGAGTGAAELTGDPMAGVVAGVTAPVVAAHGAQYAGKYVPAVTTGQKRALGDKILKDLATDPKTAATAPIDNPLGTKATLGESVGDQGLLQAESMLAGTDPKFKAQLKDIQGEQNRVRVKTIKDLADPMANPKDVADHFVNHLDQLDAHHAAVVANAEKQAQSIANTLPDAQAIDALGNRLQDVTAPRMKTAREMRSRAYDAVDPDGTMHIVATPAAKVAQKMLAEHDPQFSEMAPVVKTAIDKVAGLREVVPFKGMMQLDAYLNGLIGENRQNYTVLNQLRELKGAVKGAVHNALENQIRWEQQQVAVGALKQENTVGYRLAQDAAAFKEARRSAGTSVALTGTGPAAGVRGVGGGEGPSGGSGVRPGAEGVAGDVRPNLDEGAAGRWQGAKDLHADFADTYRQGIVGQGLENEFGRFTQRGSDVAKKAFVPGDAGGENVRSWLRAGGDDAKAVIEDIAATRLREMMKGGDQLTPQVLDAWKTKYGPALNEIPDFARRFDNAATATQSLADATAAREAALSDYQKGIAKRFLAAEGENDVTHVLGSMLLKPDSTAQFRQLKTEMVGNPQGWEGVKKGLVDVIQGKTGNAAILGGENVMSGARMPKLVRERADTLREVFGDDGYKNILNVVDDLERSGAAQALVADVNSNTALKLKPLLETIANNSANQSWGTVMTAAFVDSVAGGGMFMKALVPIMVGRAALKHLQQKGIAGANQFVQQGLLHPEVGQAMLQRAVNADGTLNMTGLAQLVRAIEATHGVGAAIVEEKREGRASGGAVRDHSAHAMTLLREAETIRKQHGKKTEALLKLPDEHVARALAVANEAIHG